VGSTIPPPTPPDAGSLGEHTVLPNRFVEDVFVGREREMHALLICLEAAVVGQGRLVFLTGEAGIGKTRTALEFATLARSRGAQVLSGRGIEDIGVPPFWPWVQIVRTYLATHDPDVIRTAMGRGAADIAQVIPDVQEHVPDLPTPPRTGPGACPVPLFREFYHLSHQGCG